MNDIKAGKNVCVVGEANVGPDLSPVIGIVELMLKQPRAMFAAENLFSTDPKTEDLYQDVSAKRKRETAPETKLPPCGVLFLTASPTLEMERYALCRALTDHRELTAKRLGCSLQFSVHDEVLLTQKRIGTAGGERGKERGIAVHTQHYP